MLGSTAISAVPAGASASAAATTTIASGNRFEPRGADVLGANADGFVYLEEDDPGLFAPGGTQEARWHSFDGQDDHTFGNENGTVLGDHLVNVDASTSPAVVTDQPLPSGTATQVTFPIGDSYVAATGDGLLLTSQNLTLYLMPWGTSTLIPVANFPTGTIQVNSVAGTNVETAHGALVEVAPSAGGLGFEYVDTTTPEAWALPTPGNEHPSLGVDTIAWLQPTDTGPGVIATVATPQPGDTTVGSVTTRTAPAQPSEPSAHYNAALPFGDDVLLSGIGGPVSAVAPSGAVTTLVAFGHGLKLTPTGDLLLVVGDTATTEAIDRVASGSTTLSTEVSLSPVPARGGQISVDGSRVVTVDDSDFNGAVVNQTVTATGGIASVTGRTELASDAVQTPSQFCNAPQCSSVGAGRGVTAFYRDDGVNGGGLLTFVGSTQSGDVIPDAHAGGPIDGTDGRSLLLDSMSLVSPDHLYDVVSKTFTATGEIPPSLADGFVYSASSENPGATITVQDTTTGTTTTVTPPDECNSIGNVQAAGRWLLLQCVEGTGDDTTNHWLVIDRTNVVAPWLDTSNDGTGTRWLGDGFVVKDDGDQDLQWTDLTDASHTWQDLGDWSGIAGQIALDQTGTQATVAWIDTDAVAHAAVLPITSSVDTPGVPDAATGVAGDKQVSLQWGTAAPGGSDLTAYQVVPTPACSTCTGTRTNGALSTTIGGLINGTHYSFQVEALNAVGYGPLSDPSTTLTPAAPISPTKVTLTSTTNPVVSSGAVTLDAKVAAIGVGAGTPTGTVTFSAVGKHHSVLSCSGGEVRPVAGGVASCVIAKGHALAVDQPYAVTAHYDGTPAFAASSGILSLKVDRARTKVSISVTPKHASAGGKLTITAKVAPAATGSVSLTIAGSRGGKARCAGGAKIKLRSSKATCTIGAGKLSTSHSPYRIVVIYLGDPNHLGSKASLSVAIKRR
jgi:hypothetical protein